LLTAIDGIVNDVPKQYVMKRYVFFVAAMLSVSLLVSLFASVYQLTKNKVMTFRPLVYPTVRWDVFCIIESLVCSSLCTMWLSRRLNCLPWMHVMAFHDASSDSLRSSWKSNSR